MQVATGGAPWVLADQTQHYDGAQLFPQDAAAGSRRRPEGGGSGFTLSRIAPTNTEATPSAGIASTSPCTGNAAAAMIDMPAAASATPPRVRARPTPPFGAGGGGGPGRSAHRN